MAFHMQVANSTLLHKCGELMEKLKSSGLQFAANIFEVKYPNT
jgi:hypothetical protein